MIGCPYCRFLSDPITGDIYDATFPCPRCGRGGAKIPRSKSFGGLGELSFFSRFTSVAKLAGYGFAFYYARKTLNDVEKAETSRNKKIKKMLGEMLPSIKSSTIYIPAFALPHAISLATNNEWPILSTLYCLGVAGMMVKTAAEPILDRAGPLEPALEQPF